MISALGGALFFLWCFFVACARFSSPPRCVCVHSPCSINSPKKVGYSTKTVQKTKKVERRGLESAAFGGITITNVKSLLFILHTLQSRVAKLRGRELWIAVIL